MKFVSIRSRQEREKFSALEQGGVLKCKYIIKCLFLFLQSVCTEYSEEAKQMSDSNNLQSGANAKRGQIENLFPHPQGQNKLLSPGSGK